MKANIIILTVSNFRSLLTLRMQAGRLADSCEQMESNKKNGKHFYGNGLDNCMDDFILKRNLRLGRFRWPLSGPRLCSLVNAYSGRKLPITIYYKSGCFYALVTWFVKANGAIDGKTWIWRVFNCPPFARHRFLLLFSNILVYSSQFIPKNRLLRHPLRVSSEWEIFQAPNKCFMSESTWNRYSNRLSVSTAHTITKAKI